MTRSGLKLPARGQSFVAVGGRLHFVAFELEVVTQTEQHLRFVLDHQNALHDGLPSAAAPAEMGKCSVNVLPRSGSLSTCTKPPWPRIV